MKKILSLILSVIMAVTAVIGTAPLVYATPDGTQIPVVHVVGTGSHIIRTNENGETEKLYPLQIPEGYIEEKMIDSYKNLPKLPGKTLFIVDVSGSMGSLTSGSSSFSRLDQACAMAMLAANQCESFKLVTTAGDDYDRICSSEWIEYPQKGFDIAKQIVKTKDNIGYGGIFTRQCLEWCKSKFKGEEFDRIIIFSDSQDCDFPDKRIPKPFGKYNYICDISAEKKGVNYKGCWTAEISGWSEHFITYIAALEGLENTFDEK
jgi:hypothetical protein